MLKNKGFITALIIGFLSSAASATESAQPQPPLLSLETTILFALNQNPSVKAEMEKIKQTHFGVREAQSAYYPQVNVTVKGGHEFDDPAGLPTGVSSSKKVMAETNSMDANLVIRQVLFNGFATDEEVDRRKKLENSATHASLVAIEGILQNAVQYYVDIWHYQRAVTESEQFVAELEDIDKKINLMNAAGAESKAKKEYVDSRTAAAHSELSKAKASLADALSNLQSLTGTLPAFTAQRPLQYDPTVRKLESYYELASTDNERLQLNRSDHAATEHQLEAQKATFLPTVSLEVNGRHGYDVGGHVGNTWNSSAMVIDDYQLFDGLARNATKGRLESQIRETEYRQEQLQRDVEKDIRKSYNQILSAKQEMTSNMKEILSSESLQEMYKKQFELGEGDIITMIEGSERLHTAKQSSFKLEANFMIDSYTLLQKIGALRKERFCASC